MAAVFVCLNKVNEGLLLAVLSLLMKIYEGLLTKIQ